MAVGESTGSPFTTQVIPSGGCRPDGEAGVSCSSHTQSASMADDKCVDVARQRQCAAGRRDPIPDGNDSERADTTLHSQRGVGPSRDLSDASTKALPRPIPGVRPDRPRRDFSRPVAELLLRRYSVTPALERLREAAGCRNRQELARWFRAREWDVDEAESRGVIPAEWLLDIFLIKGVNPNWILTGRGSRHLCPVSMARPLADADLVEACLNARSGAE